MKNLLWLTTLLTLVSCSALRQSKSPKLDSVETKPSLTTNFSQAQQALIMEADTSVAMRLFLTTNDKDSVLLRAQCEDVKPNKDDIVLEQFVNRLYRTVTDSMSLGVGIAAPQVGILKNIIWVQRFDKEGFPFEVYLNPKIVHYSKKKQPCTEGCLSIPDKRATTQNRAYAIKIEYDKMDGTQHTEVVEDFTAVIFQHEIDHLNGILFIDHLEKEAPKVTPIAADADPLYALMQGSFNSEVQAMKDTNYYNISLQMYPIWQSKKAMYLYVEQALDSKQDAPYRIRIYKLEKLADDSYKSIIYKIKDEKSFIGKWRTPEYFNQFDESILEKREGCAVFLQKQEDGSYKGSTKDDNCKSTLRGASYATSIVRIEKGKVISWDQGFDAEDKQVWGATEGGYVFRKL